MKLPARLVIATALTGFVAHVAQARDADVFRTLPADRADLDALRWQARPVLLFAPDADDPAYRAQMQALRAETAALRDRDIVVLSDTRPGAKGALRERLGGDGFRFVLLGKDGGVKLTSPSPVGMSELFATIDAMPMRQTEMAD